MTVDEFMSQLGPSATSNGRRDFKNEKKIEKTYLSVPDHFGRYQVLPMNDVVSGFPFVEMPNTREVNIPKMTIKSDGTEHTWNLWVKLLPKSAYTMKDDTGRQVSSLTAADESLLDQAYSVHQQLMDEVGYRENAMNSVIREFLRKKNYTIFDAYCINFWKEGNTRNPDRQNFESLFVVTSNKFRDCLRDDVNNYGLINNVEDGWLDKVYNRELSGRDGFLMFTVTKATSGAGFQFTTNHAVGKSDYLKHVVIPEDNLMGTSCVEQFLGSIQINHDDDDKDPAQRRLFSSRDVQDALNYMVKQLQAIRIAKEKNGNSIDVITKAITDVNKNVMGEAIERAKEKARERAAAATTTAARPTPFSAGSSFVQQQVDTTPVQHNDPMADASAGTTNSPFSSPSFASRNGNNLPF